MFFFYAFETIAIAFFLCYVCAVIEESLWVPYRKRIREEKRIKRYNEELSEKRRIANAEREKELARIDTSVLGIYTLEGRG